mmetsp:Transcript_30248/g.39618  ORF Transcript_30248/g.39618 Transcript_30248/m.39618 type:complete len:111 (-) Transcript_30248:44-376(-)
MFCALGRSSINRDIPCKLFSKYSIYCMEPVCLEMAMGLSLTILTSCIFYGATVAVDLRLERRSGCCCGRYDKLNLAGPPYFGKRYAAVEDVGCIVIGCDLSKFCSFASLL